MMLEKVPLLTIRLCVLLPDESWHMSDVYYFFAWQLISFTRCPIAHSFAISPLDLDSRQAILALTFWLTRRVNFHALVACWRSFGWWSQNHCRSKRRYQIPIGWSEMNTNRKLTGQSSQMVKFSLRSSTYIQLRPVMRIGKNFKNDSKPDGQP